MVHLNPILAAISCLLSLTAGSPVDAPRAASEYKPLEEITLAPLQWRGFLEAGKPEVFLKGADFNVCMAGPHLSLDSDDIDDVCIGH